jgi:hypothetical protein
MPARGFAAVLGLALVAGACSNDSSNPFANVAASRPPSAAAAILFVSSSYAAQPGPREILAIDLSGGTLERLTACATASTPCDFLQVAPSPDRNRVAAIRTNVGAEPGSSALYFMDLSRSVETILVATRRVTFVDWSPDNAFLLYTIKDAGGREDLYYNFPNGSSEQNLTSSTDVAERAPRVDPGASTAAYERIDATGVARIYVYQTIPVTTGDVVGPALPGTPYVVGADADPAWSPDATRLVFRRLTGIGSGGLGTWDILSIKTDGTELQTVATGAAYRGSPDWGKAGIVFVETEAAAGESRLVLVQPDGTGRKVLRTEPSAFGMAAPRFLYGQ